MTEIIIDGCIMDNTKLPLLSKIRFKGDTTVFNVRASNIAFAICVVDYKDKPVYTVIDFMNNIRGTTNEVFGSGVETELDIQDMLERFTQGEIEISHRNNVPLEIKKISGIMFKG